MQIVDVAEEAVGLYVVGGGIGLHVEEQGDGDVGLYCEDYVDALGYRSREPSHMWFPATLAVAGEPAEVSLDRLYNGSVVVKCKVYDADIYIPLALPGVLFGQNVTVRSVQIHYRCSSSSSYISSTRLSRQTGLLSPPDQLVIDTADRKSTRDDFYTVKPSDGELDSERGILVLAIGMFFANATDAIYVGGVRLDLGHR
jgi:hypothetical protein